MHKLIQLDVNITNRCNLNCVHCGIDAERTSTIPEMTLGEYKDLFVDARDLGAEKLDITGGEPVLRRDLPDIVSAGSSLGYYVKLNTNGTLLTRNRLVQLKERGLDGIAISLDGSTPERYGHIRRTGESEFYRSVETIRLSKELGLYTKVNTVVFESTLDDIPHITQLCIDLGADAHRVCYFSPIGRGSRCKEKPVDPCALISFVKEKMMSYTSEIDLSFGSPFSNSDTGCFENTDMLQVLSDGSVYPCSVLTAYGVPLGNVHQRSVVEIWNDEAVWKDYSRYAYCCFNGIEKPECYMISCPARKIRAEDL